MNSYQHGASISVTVNRFESMMKHVLRRPTNMNKEHWREGEAGFLADKILEKASLLYKEVETPKMKTAEFGELCVDIANYAMMIEDHNNRKAKGAT